MPKGRPVVLHVNSQGKKYLLLHAMIYDSEQQYLFYPMDGHIKTHLYNDGFLVGKQKGIKLYEYFEDAVATATRMY